MVGAEKMAAMELEHRLAECEARLVRTEAAYQKLVDGLHEIIDMEIMAGETSVAYDTLASAEEILNAK